jgi:SAM-dependent methyltransferase
MPAKPYAALWGDRRRFGVMPDTHDPDWILWQQKAYTDFYQVTQQRGIGLTVNGMSYPVIQRLDFNGRHVLEVGPGIIRHLRYMTGKPASYTICDVNEKVLAMAERQLREASIVHNEVLLENGTADILPFGDESFDVIISFNSLEHVYPLDRYLAGFSRILKDHGMIAGGIPCEGGLAWGVGRFLTSRRYVHRHYKINYDKIICWEHPNFADSIIGELDARFQRRYLRLHPFSFLPMDCNLTASFMYEKKHET